MDEFFDPSFLSELEDLADLREERKPAAASPASLPEKFAVFLDPRPEDGTPERLDEAAFLLLSPAVLAQRTNVLVEICRQSGQAAAVQAVENFVVFFQALVPTLPEDTAHAVKGVFFRLVPTLIHIAYNDFGDGGEQRREGRKALQQLETILIEISNVRLAPSESQLVFKSIDQLTSFIGMGDYALANEVVSSRLLGLIAKNKLTRALFRLMEVEVKIQTYLRDKLGYLTPQIRIPEDFEALGDYGPIRILSEEAADGTPSRFIQVQLPDLEVLRDIVLRLVASDGVHHDLRFDALGGCPLEVAPGTYALGLLYEPEGGVR